MYDTGVNQKMKILFILTYYHPYWTGLSQYAKRVAEGLSQKGHTCRVLTTKHKNGLKDQEVLNGVTVIRKPVLFRLSRSLISLNFVLSFYKEIKNSERIVVYLPLAEVLLVAIISKIFNKPLFLVHNGDLVLPKGFFNRLLEKFYYLSTFFAIQVSKGIIIHTEDYAQNSKLLSKFKNKWKVIIPPFKLGEEDKEITKKLKAKIPAKMKYIVGFSGRFVEEKGFDYLLKAIPLVCQKLPNTIFVFAGETNLSYEKFYESNQDLIKASDKNLKFLGLLTQDEMSSFYSLCDLLVLPSRTDCFPFVQAEAMLSNVPIVVTDIPGARWPVKQTKMGLIVKTRDEKALAAGIIEVLGSRQEYLKGGDKAKEIFNYEKSLESFNQLLREGV